MGPAQLRGANVVKQVTKKNFHRALQQMREHIQESDYIAVSTQKSGVATRPWHRILPIDSPETSYLKSKLAAEKYELFQVAVCPFRIEGGSKVVAFPYNFHLFPRDELNVSMPSYSFSCQASALTSMAREGFDFNTCIYDGISYLSRVQESKLKDKIKLPSVYKVASSRFSVSDKIFVDKIKSKVKHWKDICKRPSKTGEDALLLSLRKLIVGSELHGSHPCLNIDICSSHQVHLVTVALSQTFDDIVSIVITNENGEPKAVRAVLTSTDEEKNLLMSEIQQQEQEHNIKIRGFREIIDLMSSSHKPIIAYDCLKDFAYIHSKFIAPLPPSLAEFMCSLRLAFQNTVDVGILLKEVGPLRKARNLPAAISYLRRQFFAPIHIEISQDDGILFKNHGHEVLRITNVFAKLCSILNITPTVHPNANQCMSSIDNYSNIFSPCFIGPQDDENENSECWMNDARSVTTSNFIFIWGFKEGTSAQALKALLHGTHAAFSEGFELKLIDKSCAVAICRVCSATSLLKAMHSGNISCGPLMDLISDGIKLAGYDSYNRVCRRGLWRADLADSLDESTLADSLDESTLDFAYDSSSDVSNDPLELHWPSDSKLNVNDLF